MHDLRGDDGVRAGEHLIELFAVPLTPGAQKTGIIGELLFLRGLALYRCTAVPRAMRARTACN